jgi:hypothetical protein
LGFSDVLNCILFISTTGEWEMEMGCASSMAVMERTLQEQAAVVRPADHKVSTEKRHQVREFGTEGDY